jgi:hypothetical protein
MGRFGSGNIIFFVKAIPILYLQYCITFYWINKSKIMFRYLIYNEGVPK